LRALVIIESPFKGETTDQEAEHLVYARRALRDSLNRGEAPFASHLLYTQVLDDSVPEERKLGMEAGWAWQSACRTVRPVVGGNSVPMTTIIAVYADYGVSSGMGKALERASTLAGCSPRIEFRRIGKNPEIRIPAEPEPEKAWEPPFTETQDGRKIAKWYRGRITGDLYAVAIDGRWSVNQAPLPPSCHVSGPLPSPGPSIWEAPAEVDEHGPPTEEPDPPEPGPDWKFEPPCTETQDGRRIVKWYRDDEGDLYAVADDGRCAVHGPAYFAATSPACISSGSILPDNLAPIWEASAGPKWEPPQIKTRDGRAVVKWYRCGNDLLAISQDGRWSWGYEQNYRRGILPRCNNSHACPANIELLWEAP
jgi:hypothetical protein